MNIIDTQKPNIKASRKTLVYGLSWIRYVMAIVFILGLIGCIVSYDTARLGALGLPAVSAGLFFLFRRARKIQHDQENLYVVRASTEKEIPFKNIISIKKSRSKVNGSRFWKLVYTDKNQTKKTIRFFSSFQKEFHASVRKMNPTVIIWTHPHFNH